MLIPGIVAIYLVAIVSQIVYTTIGYYINDLVLEFIQKPLLVMSQRFVSIVIILFLYQLLWFFGLHGSNILAPVMEWSIFNCSNQKP